MMMMSGLGLVAAAAAIPKAMAMPWDGSPPQAPPPNGQYIFADEFDGPAGSAPDASKWEVATAREAMEDPTFWELPENVGQYRDDRRNVYRRRQVQPRLPRRQGRQHLSTAARSSASSAAESATTGKPGSSATASPPGAWPAWYLANNSPVNGGEVDIMEWYGNGKWAAGTAVHAKLNGGEHVSQTITVDSAWHTWRVQWDDAGMRFWKDYTDGAAPYFTCRAERAARLAVQYARLPDCFRSWTLRSRAPAAAIPPAARTRRTC